MDFSISQIINIIYFVFAQVRNAIAMILELTIARGSPQLATQFADGITLMVTITAIWIMFEFVTSAKNILRILVFLGWILLVLSILITVLV